jgi:hypothetical protein
MPSFPRHRGAGGARRFAVALLFSLAPSVLILACGGDDDGGDAPPPPPPPSATVALYDTDGDLTQSERFYDAPFPSDARVDAMGRPEYRGFPRPATPNMLLDSLLPVVGDRVGWPVMPVAYFRFTAPLEALDHEQTVPASADQRVLLVDVDADSPTRGRLLPTVAWTPRTDAYVPAGLLAVAPRPGVVLHAGRTYAFVVTRALRDAEGRPVEPAPAVTAALRGETPPGARGAATAALFAPLRETLAARAGGVASLAPASIVSATVLTTGDVVQELFDLSERVRADHDGVLTITGVDPDDGAAHARYCELQGTLTVPQFQRGTPPWDTEGLFAFDGAGRLVPQRMETVPVTVTFPRAPMPASGYPLVVYFHGSGGRSDAAADRGRWTPGGACAPELRDTWEGREGCYAKGLGPAHVVARHGFGMAGAALPVNPERLPGASSTAYLNFNNLAGGRDLFRQGILESRLFLDALLALEVAPEVVAACTGMELPAGATAYRFDPGAVYAQGQSMGGQYTNMFSAVEPRVRAAVPTGAGGHWTHFIEHTTLIPGATTLLRNILGARSFTFLHPAVHVFGSVWERVDPFAYVPRIARRPLPGHPVRAIYEPVGLGDSFFSTETFDAIALAYGHRQAGAVVWPSMQEALALDGLEGLLPFPVSGNARSERGEDYTGVVVQFEGDGVYDPHAIYLSRDDVKYQYGCFLASHLRDGRGSVPPPVDDESAACP